MLKITSLKILSLVLRNFELPAGEAVAVTGASGAGKSLVLRGIADLIPNQGEVSLDDRSRAAMSGALVQGPKVLLLDEPTSGLDGEATMKVEKRLNRFLQDGGSVLFVTHDVEQAKRLAKRRLHIADGHIEERIL